MRFLLRSITSATSFLRRYSQLDPWISVSVAYLPVISDNLLAYFLQVSLYWSALVRAISSASQPYERLALVRCSGLNLFKKADFLCNCSVFYNFRCNLHWVSMICWFVCSKSIRVMLLDCICIKVAFSLLFDPLLACSSCSLFWINPICYIT